MNWEFILFFGEWETRILQPMLRRESLARSEEYCWQWDFLSYFQFVWRTRSYGQDAGLSKLSAGPRRSEHTTNQQQHFSFSKKYLINKTCDLNLISFSSIKDWNKKKYQHGGKLKCSTKTFWCFFLQKCHYRYYKFCHVSS